MNQFKNLFTHFIVFEHPSGNGLASVLSSFRFFFYGKRHSFNFNQDLSGLYDLPSQGHYLVKKVTKIHGNSVKPYYFNNLKTSLYPVFISRLRIKYIQTRNLQEEN